MFKSAKRMSEKNKIKAVFKLQFQATQVPQVKAKALTISLVPADVGKPTVRLEKAAILDGTCFWENPVYETVKLIREPKTGRFHEKYYHFIVSTGSSKAGLLGEASINFADYAEAAKPSTVSLPLKTSNYGATGAILHVTVHNMQGSVDQRDSEAGESPLWKSQDGSLKNQFGNQDRNGNSNLSFTEDDCINKFTSENAENNRNFRDLLVDDTTFKQDSMPKERTYDALPDNSHMHEKSNTDCSVGSASDGSMVDLQNSPEVNLPRDRLPEASGRPIEKLVRKISSLERQAELSELELQSLRKQIVKESKRGQDLSRQIVNLKEERDTIVVEYQQLKSLMSCSDDREVSSHLQIETENLKALLEEIRRELNHEKDLNTTLRFQLQKTEDSNSKLIHAVKDLDETLEQKDREIADLLTTIKAGKYDKEDPEEVSDCIDEANEVDMLKQEITDLYGELEVYKKDREELKMHMDQLATDYEILEKENHGISLKLEQTEIEQIKMQNECSEYLATIKELGLRIERSEKEIKKQALELSESSDTIDKLQTQVERLEKEMEKQAQSFEDDLEGITLVKIEQEQRAIRAEEALRKTRSNNAIAAEQIQEEFGRLHVEMSSKFDENEKLATKAVAEANDLRMQKRVLEEMLQKAGEELGTVKEQFEVKLQELSDQRDIKAKQIEQMSGELKEKYMQIEKFGKQEEEIQKLNRKNERLKIKKSFSEAKVRDESGGMEQIKTSLGEQEMLQMWSKEREELKKEYSSARKEAQKLQEESNSLRSLKDQRETMVRTLQSDIQKLTVQYSELKHSLLEVEQEKENLRKEVFKLEDDLQKKEEVIIITEKKLHSNSLQARNPDIEQITSKDCKSAGLYRDSAKDVISEKLNLVELPGMSSTKGRYKENGVGTAPDFSDDCYSTHLLSEMAILKERNKNMEGELKEMQERYSEISLKFAEVEGERQRLVMTVRNLKNSKKK